MTSFLIEYNRITGSVSVSDYDNRSDAIRERLKRSREIRDENIEIVSVNTDSRETLRRSHARYFHREQPAV